MALGFPGVQAPFWCLACRSVRDVGGGPFVASSL